MPVYVPSPVLGWGWTIGTEDDQHEGGMSWKTNKDTYPSGKRRNDGREYFVGDGHTQKRGMGDDGRAYPSQLWTSQLAT